MVSNYKLNICNCGGEKFVLDACSIGSKFFYQVAYYL